MAIRLKITIALVLIIIGVILVYPKVFRKNSKGESITVADYPSLSTTPTITSTPSPTSAVILTTPPVSCNTQSSTAKKLAQAFMTAHKNRDANDALDQLGQPYSTEEETQLAFLQGSDTGEEPRLYALAQYSYTTKSFSIGAITSSGQDSNDRGAQLCTLTIYESRISTASDTYSETTETRYLDFTLDELGNMTLTAFKETKKGSKYSGFN